MTFLAWSLVIGSLAVVAYGFISQELRRRPKPITVTFHGTPITVYVSKNPPEYFRKLLSKFSRPEDVFGPPDLAFLDDTFRSSAIRAMALGGQVCQECLTFPCSCRGEK